MGEGDQGRRDPGALLGAGRVECRLTLPAPTVGNVSDLVAPVTPHRRRAHSILTQIVHEVAETHNRC
jgi:hypothetical protein